MIDTNKISKGSAILLIDEIEKNIQKFADESIQSIDKQRYLAQKRQLLIHAYGKTRGGMSQLIIKDLISEIDHELTHLDENVRYCDQYKSYYTEILKVLKETVEELHLVK